MITYQISHLAVVKLTICCKKHLKLTGILNPQTGNLVIWLHRSVIINIIFPLREQEVLGLFWKAYWYDPPQQSQYVTPPPLDTSHNTSS